MINSLNRFDIPFTECDIEYISPSDYHPPETQRYKENSGKGFGWDDDAYERLVRGSLKQLEKQKVIEFH